MVSISKLFWLSFLPWKQTMGVQCMSMVVDKVGLVMILFTVEVSVPVIFWVLFGMLERIRANRVLSSGTRRCSVGLHRTLIPRVDRPANAQFRPISDCPQGHRSKSVTCGDSPRTSFSWIQNYGLVFLSSIQVGDLWRLATGDFPLTKEWWIGDPVIDPSRWLDRNGIIIIF